MSNNDTRSPSFCPLQATSISIYYKDQPTRRSGCRLLSSLSRLACSTCELWPTESSRNGTELTQTCTLRRIILSKPSLWKYLKPYLTMYSWGNKVPGTTLDEFRQNSCNGGTCFDGSISSDYISGQRLSRGQVRKICIRDSVASTAVDSR